jgi:hypothetical protein
MHYINRPIVTLGTITSEESIQEEENVPDFALPKEIYNIYLDM